MPTTQAKVKKEVFAEFTKANVKLSASGRKYAQRLWAETLGHFFKRYRSQADEKWRKRVVRNYAMRAVRAIVKESSANAKGQPVGDAEMRKAARKVIRRFRKLCPAPVRAKAMTPPTPKNAPTTVALHGGLCELYPA